MAADAAPAPAPAPEPFKLETVEEQKESGYWTVLLFGAPGAGKTSLAGTFPRPLFIDTDLKTLTLRSKWFKEWFKADAPAFVRQFTEDTDENGLFIEAKAFLEATRFINRAMSKAADQFDTIVVDSLTTTQGLAMNLGLELAQRRERSKTMQEARRAGGIPVPLATQADYGAEMAVFEQFVSQLVALPKHIVCTAHEREQTNNKGQILSVDPYLIGSRIRSLIGAWFEEIWHLDTDNHHNRILTTQSDHQKKCIQTRHGVPNGLVNPTFPRILEVSR